MNDYNLIKADEHAERMGEMDEFDNAMDIEEIAVLDEVPDWIDSLWSTEHRVAARAEAKRRVMQAIKERGEP